MMRRKKKYGIEEASEKLLIEIRRSIKKITDFFFVIPKKKMDKIAWLMETIAWIILGIALVLRR